MLADAVVVWTVLFTVFQYQQLWVVGLSRTRELFTLYLVVAVAVIAPSWRSRPRWVLWLVGAQAALVLVGFVTWSRELGTYLGINFWSEYLTVTAYLAFGVAYGAARWRVWRWFAVAGGLIVACLQVAAVVFGIRLASVSEDMPEFYRTRAVSATLAMLMVLSLAILLIDRGTPRRLLWAAGPLLAVAVVLSQHRTVWLSLLVLLAYCLLLRRRVVPAATKIAAATVVFFVFALALPGVLPGSSSDAPPGTTSATSLGTTDWRLRMWESRLQAPRPLGDWIWGSTFGTTPAFGPTSEVMRPVNSAHNMLLDMQLMTGLLGLGLLIANFVISLRGMRWGTAGFGFLLSMIPFALFFQWPVWSWIMIGLGVGLFSDARRRARREFAPGEAPVVDALAMDSRVGGERAATGGNAD